MDSVDNPYTPNAGAIPEALLGRNDQLEAFSVLLKRMAKGRSAQSMIITGLRGVGKTVLLNRFRKIAEDVGWQVVFLEASKHDEVSFRSAISTGMHAALLQLSPKKRWSERFKRAAGILSSFSSTVSVDGGWTVKLGISPIEGRADTGDLGLDLTDLFVAIGEAAKEKETGVVLLIDELQFLEKVQLEALIQAVHRTVQDKLPFTFVGAGLPQIAKLAGEAKSYAERLFIFPKIGFLSGEDARSALIEPARGEGVEFENEAVELATKITHGYPYFIQELGYQAWGIGDNNRITVCDVKAARDPYESKLDNSFFRVRLDRATHSQTAYMRAMAQLGPGPQKAEAVAAILGRKSPEVSNIKRDLIKTGLLYTPSHGYAAFTVPDFDKFMLRAVPDLEIPEVQRRRSKSRR